MTFLIALTVCAAAAANLIPGSPEWEEEKEFEAYEDEYDDADRFYYMWQEEKDEREDEERENQ